MFTKCGKGNRGVRKQKQNKLSNARIRIVAGNAQNARNQHWVIVKKLVSAPWLGLVTIAYYGLLCFAIAIAL